MVFLQFVNDYDVIGNKFFFSYEKYMGISTTFKQKFLKINETFKIIETFVENVDVDGNLKNILRRETVISELLNVEKLECRKIK